MSAKPKTVLSMAAAAKVLGMTPDFVLSLTLSGAHPPGDGPVVEIEYDMDGDEVAFTALGVERFLKKCPFGDMVNSTKAAERLGVHRSQLSLFRFTGVPTTDGRVVKLPVWLIGGGEFVRRDELEAFALHHQGAVERKAARAHEKKYANRGRKPAAQEA